MFEIQLTEDGRQELLKIADNLGVDSDKLLDLYKQVMTSNFEQDLYDIVSENPDFFEA